MSSSMKEKENLQETDKVNKKESEVIVLSIIDKSYFNRDIPENNYEIPQKIISSYEISKNNEDNNITLFTALYNSLVNKDHKSFIFCIQQKNEVLIEETVKQMNSDCLGKFIEKSVDIFQSNSFYSKFIIPWFKNIVKYKKVEIFRKKNIENLKKISIFIKDKIKCFDSLCLLKEKINKINKIFCNKNNEKNNDNKNSDEKPIIFEPLLTYYESDDEEDAKLKKNKKNKMEIEGFEEIEKEEENEDNDDINIINDDDNNEKEESDEDDLDEEIDNMLLDENEKIPIKNKNNENKKDENENEELDNEDEENEDNNEEDEN